MLTRKKVELQMWSCAHIHTCVCICMCIMCIYIYIIQRTHPVHPHLPDLLGSWSSLLFLTVCLRTIYFFSFMSNENKKATIHRNRLFPQRKNNYLRSMFLVVYSCCQKCDIYPPAVKREHTHTH